MEITEINTKEFVDLMSATVNLQLRNEYKDGVIANFERIKAIAQIVNEFELPDTVEVAPIFEP